LKSKGRALEYHFLVEVWGAEGSLTESINKFSERLALFLSDVDE